MISIQDQLANRNRDLYPSWLSPVILKETDMDGQILATGVKKDEGKPRWELVPFDAVEGAVKVLTFGASKYAARNWENGIQYGRVFGAIMRHLWKWWHGENSDPETGLSHLDHALCELLFLSAYEKREMAQLDDRAKTIKAVERG